MMMMKSNAGDHTLHHHSDYLLIQQTLSHIDPVKIKFPWYSDYLLIQQTLSHIDPVKIKFPWYSIRATYKNQ